MWIKRHRKVTSIKESQYFKTLFDKLTEYERELKRLEASEGDFKRKDMMKEAKKTISLKVSTSKTKIKDDNKDISENSLTDEEM